MTTTKETKHLLSKLEHKFPELFRLAEGIMLTGSYASNEHMRSSDIDIVVLSKNINYVHSETTRWASTYVQFVFLPYYKFPNIIMENKGNNPYTSMIRKGIIYKDTTSKLLTKAKRELSKKENVHRCEVIDFALIHQVTSNIDSIKASQSDSEKIYCASELLLNLTRLILAKYTGDAKLLSRSISTNDLGSNLIDAYQNLVETKDSSKFTHEVENILTNYGGAQHTFTTGCVYTYPHDRQIMVFSPSQSGNDIQFQKYLLEIKETFQDYKIYGFYVGKNQSMEEGYYIYIHTIKTAIEELLAKLNSYKSSIVEKALQNGITFSFPYVTLFHEGLQFGGKEIFNDLLPFFTELWTSYLSHTSGIPVEYRKKYSLIFATNYFSMLNSRSDILQCEFSNFLSLLDDTLFLEVVDPNGLYNITQVDMMSKETLKIYMNNYSDNSVSYKALMESIESESITELDNVNRILTRFFELIQSIPECDIIVYPYFRTTFSLI